MTRPRRPVGNERAERPSCLRGSRGALLPLRRIIGFCCERPSPVHRDRSRLGLGLRAHRRGARVDIQDVRHLQFCQGSIAALAAFVFYFLHVQLNWPWPLTMAVCLLVVGPGLGLALERLALVLADVSETLKIVSTIGIILVVLSLGEIWFPSTPSFPSYLPTETYSLLGVNIGWDETTISSSPLSSSAASTISSDSSAWAWQCARSSMIRTSSP